MIYSRADLELLRLVAFCRDVPMDAGAAFASGLFSPWRISQLLAVKALKLSRTAQTLRPTPYTYGIIARAGYPTPAELKPNNKKEALARRENAFSILTTFYRAGIHVFCFGQEGRPVPLADDSFITSAEIRRSRGNTQGSATFYGIAFLGTTAYFVWHVSEGKGLYFCNEVRLFNSLVEEMRTRTGQDYDRAVIYMGESIATIAHMALGHDDGGPRRTNRDGLSMMSFDTAYDDLKLPIHFVPAGDTGAYQLKIMHIPGYREALARAIMGDAYTAPHEGLPDTDTMLDDMPAVIAVDMDIKRIDRATVQAGEAGYDTIAIYALPWQTDFLLERYPGAGVYALDIGELNAAMGNGLALYEPGEDALVTEEGRKHATTVTPHRQAGGGAGEESGPMGL